MELSVTLIIVIITALVSIGGFSNQKTIDDLVFYPPSVKRGQVYRFITHGFIHADVAHLIFNMIALYSFGEAVEKIYAWPEVFGSKGKLVFLLLYFTALIIASVPDYIKHRNHFHFRSLGASGAVSAVIFSSVLFNPRGGIGFAFLPPSLSIPGWIFAIIYLIVSTILARKAQDNIGHGAHITGAIYGLVFSYVATKLFTDYDVIATFLSQIKGGE